LLEVSDRLDALGALPQGKSPRVPLDRRLGHLLASCYGRDSNPWYRCWEVRDCTRTGPRRRNLYSAPRVIRLNYMKMRRSGPVARVKKMRKC